MTYSSRLLTAALLGLALLAAACGGKTTPAATCEDNIENQSESDVDCGGSCQACADGQACLVDADCLSGNCVVGVCEPGAETCDDGALNQNETDVDCGGVCGGCADGLDCLVDSDCLTGNCENGVCSNDVEDLCPDDPDKTAPGECGCGTPDDDSDSDGLADCIDGCPDDDAKSEEGQCGCGLADTDTDGDGFADCIDGCPDDDAKSERGQCGCGVADTDTDDDAVADCLDGCPEDPLKVEPGICDCGTPDTDTDADGAADCVDGCPGDAAKIEPGQCGCGALDTDTDADGTADCLDPCPDDAAKIDPGLCGCGTPDTDSDADGTPDCNDGCPGDADKVAPGVCGCGSPDVDTDGDGALDCDDQCPDDPTKTAPGTCGCGFPDTDTDSDGTADCLDACPVDPDKTETGDCGCGIPETDTDGDATPDCNDGCDADPDKVAPGQCGCGIPDTDSDSDGTADCIDGCVDDPLKTAPGICGCGVADDDSDSDGTADCIDPCPNDPADHCANCHPMGYAACPSGASEWCYNAPVDGESSDQARAACQACLGVACVLRQGDCAGDAWGLADPIQNPEDLTFGFEDGCSGPRGRIWDYSLSWETFGFWAGMPAAIDPDALTFTDAAALQGTRMTIAEAGGYLWGSSGGGASGVRLAQYSVDGALLNSHSPGIDMRSVFTRVRGSAPLLARGYDSGQIRTQTSPGVFGNDVILTGGTLDAQSAVVYDHLRALFVALTNGVIHRWDDAGIHVDAIPLIGWDVDNPGESAYPQGRGLAVSQSGHYLTYHDQILSVWDETGKRIHTTILTGAGTSFDSYFSFSYTGPFHRGFVYVLDAASGAWRRWIIGW